jgi:hypothetical protein
VSVAQEDGSANRPVAVVPGCHCIDRDPPRGEFDGCHPRYLIDEGLDGRVQRETGQGGAGVTMKGWSQQMAGRTAETWAPKYHGPSGSFWTP